MNTVLSAGMTRLRERSGGGLLYSRASKFHKIRGISWLLRSKPVNFIRNEENYAKILPQVGWSPSPDVNLDTQTRSSGDQKVLWWTHTNTITHGLVYVTGHTTWIFVRMCNVQFKENILLQSVGSRSITRLLATKVLSSCSCTFKPSNPRGFFMHHQVYDLTGEVIYIQKQH